MRWVYEHLPERVERLLDAGCHDGAGTAAFATRAQEAVGIDLDLPALQEGARRHAGVGLAAASADALPFGDAAFDCVVFSEVLEHVPAAVEARCIAEIRRVLRPGGTLILTTPHRGTFWWADPLMAKPHVRRLNAALRGNGHEIKGHKHYRVGEVLDLLAPHFDVELVERPGQYLYPLAYWGHLLPLGVGRHPLLVRVWQAMMDYDYQREHGDAAYNVCIVARAR
jgi:SAM-dependent methyltransferase